METFGSFIHHRNVIDAQHTACAEGQKEEDGQHLETAANQLPTVEAKHRNPELINTHMHLTHNST